LHSAQSKFSEYSTIYLRLALGAAYLSSVASRFGLWGEGNGWGNFHNFLIYTAKLNPFLPASFILPVGWIATIAETVLAVLIVFGIRLRVAAALSGASSKLIPTLNEKFPPPHGVDSPVVTNLLQLCGVTIMVALLLTLYGLWRSKASDEVARGR